MLLRRKNMGALFPATLSQPKILSATPNPFQIRDLEKVNACVLVYIPVNRHLCHTILPYTVPYFLQTYFCYCCQFPAFPSISIQLRCARRKCLYLIIIIIKMHTQIYTLAHCWVWCARAYQFKLSCTADTRDHFTEPFYSS